MATKITMHKVTCTVPAALTGTTAYSKNIRGRILAVQAEYSNTTPASTSDRDVILYHMNPADNDDPADAMQTILSLSGLGADPSADNRVYYPRTPVQDYLGVDVTYDGTNEIYEPFIVFGQVMISVANAAAGDITTLYLMVEEF